LSLQCILLPLPIKFSFLFDGTLPLYLSGSFPNLNLPESYLDWVELDRDHIVSLIFNANLRGLEGRSINESLKSNSMIDVLGSMHY
jgi:hypothetical protein